MTVAILLGLLPVLCFLAALYLLDSFKLVRLRHIFLSIAIGFTSAFVSLAINSFLLSTLAIELKIYSRYLAPVIEETLKAGYIVYLIRTNKTGFAVDSALHGFAVGAGFALIENIYYLAALNDTVMMVWIVRGFGTAVMHGGVTALFAIIAKSFFEPEKTILSGHLYSQHWRLMRCTAFSIISCCRPCKQRCLSSRLCRL